MSTNDRQSRAAGALYGLAIGDALGMPTQLLSPDEVRSQFGKLDGFKPAATDHPIAAGMPAGSITDDTEQALLLAQALIDGRGHVDQEAFALSLLRWEEQMKARGSLDLLGPSTKAAVEAVAAGVPASEAGKNGATNGAAMRIAPAGIVAGSKDLDSLVALVIESSAVSHNTNIALSGAAAVAAAVSAGIDGANCLQALQSGLEAARLASTRGNWVAGGGVPERIELALMLADSSRPRDSADAIIRLLGTSLATQESVPAAIGIAACYPDDPFGACLAAAASGGDSDTIAAMAGAILGAVHGVEAFPADAVELVRSVNKLDLDSVAAELLKLRR
ncbi:MAG: ADP-ribosylglycohydrolase family protein [Cryobacterium sp.]|nr:ADP-ribosylglycohydrolase family protein [Cryobacterium sp.]